MKSETGICTIEFGSKPTLSPKRVLVQTYFELKVKMGPKSI